MRNACELKIFSHVKICRYFISHAKSHITHATHTRNACEMQNIFACENWGSCVKYCRSHAKTQIITCDILARSHATSHTNAIETNLTVRMWTACERHLFTCKKKPVTCKKIIPPDAAGDQSVTPTKAIADAQLKILRCCGWTSHRDIRLLGRRLQASAAVQRGYT